MVSAGRAGQVLGLDSVQADAIATVGVWSKAIPDYRKSKRFGKYDVHLDSQAYKRLRGLYAPDYFKALKLEKKWLVEYKKAFSNEYFKPRDKYDDCYWVKSMSYEVTNEPVSDGIVASILTWVLNGEGIFTREKYLSLDDDAPEKRINLSHLITLSSDK